MMRDEIHARTTVIDEPPSAAARLDRSRLLGFKTLTALASQPAPTQESLALLHNKIGEPPPPPGPAAPILATKR